MPTHVERRRRIAWTIAMSVAVAAATLLMPGSGIAGPPFRTDDPEPVEYEHWEIRGFSQMTQTRGDNSGIFPGLEVNYGALPDLQLHVIAPLALDERTGGNWQSGYGDTELGVKYRFIQEDEEGWRPMVGTFPLVQLPSGNASRGLGTGQTHAYLPLWIQKSFGEWSTYGGGGRWINPGMGNKDYWFTGWQVQRKITEQLRLGAEIFHQTANIVGGKDSTGFNVGGFYDFTENHHLLLSVGSGLQNANETNQFSYYLAYQLTF
jgi:hypothetical protein